MRIHRELKDLVSICFNNYPLKNENVINLVQAYIYWQTENKLALNDFDQRAILVSSLWLRNVKTEHIDFAKIGKVHFI